jgi:hypothetical protein
MTDNQTDLRRAKALHAHDFRRFWLMTSEPTQDAIDNGWEYTDQDVYLNEASAIRASDDAAGLVMVPRAITLDMSEAFEAAANDGCMMPELWDTMIATHEGGDGG